MNQNELKVLKELRSDLFYQIESKHGAEKASKYPSILKADELISNSNVKTTTICECEFKSYVFIGLTKVCISCGGVIVGSGI